MKTPNAHIRCLTQQQQQQQSATTHMRRNHRLRTVGQITQIDGENLLDLNASCRD